MLILFLIVFIDLVGFGIVIPLLPFYGEHFQADPFTVSLMMAVYSLGQFVAAPFWGRLSDTIGRRPVLIWSLFGAVLSYIWLGFAETMWMLFAARLVGGLMAGNISTAFAYIADITTPENRAKGMGLVGAAFGLGFIVGPAIGGILAGPDPLNADFQTPAFVAAGLSFVAFVLTVLKLKESLPAEVREAAKSGSRPNRWKQISEASQRPGIGLLLIISFLATFVFAGMETTFAMWSRRQLGWGPEQNGYLFAFIGIIAAALQGGAVGRLTKRFGEGNLIVQGALALAIGMALIPFSTTLPILLVAMTIVAYGFSVINPALNSLISLKSPAGEQGMMMGVSRSATTMARVLGPAWAGVFFAQLGKEWPYYAGAVMMLLVAYLGLKSLKENQAAKDEAVAVAAEEDRSAPID
ncbi:MFS transporter [Magnetovibrio sp. PR-2]|uniref:MFS transporter n=1 Tax=Magnetovibrio sp. PR-2 TaxID=3120356 RepID=UPI002FCE5CE8